MLAFVVAGVVRDISPLITSLGRTDVKTSISMRPASDVPFPAVIVDLGRAMDPMAHLRNSRDMVIEKDIDEHGE